ncbi:MAG: UGSC family (seleno)protein [Dehalococcoidales bacterium]
MGKPGVYINCDTFDDDAISASNDHSMPTFRHRQIKSSEFYKLRGKVDTIRPIVEAVFDDLIDALTTPLTPEEANPPQQKRDEDGPPSVKFVAGSYPIVFEEFNQDFLARYRGDGLPLVPPTPESVRWMLSGTTRSPDEVIGRIKPKLGIATIEKIAINAVMAGARPEYLPVIITAMEVILDTDFDHLHVLTSAGSFTFMIVVTGPLAKEINMSSGIGFLGHGWRANNTIGRSVRLATLNIGRTWPGMNDMALTGRVSPHTFYTFSENEESPWQPYHTTRGFKPDESCVTVASISSSSPQTNPYGGTIGTWTANGILDNIVAHLMRTDRPLFPRWGITGMILQRVTNNHLIILFPELVSELNKMGYDQESLKTELYRRIAVPYEDLTDADKKGILQAIENGAVPAARKAVFEKALNPGAMVPVLVSPECIQLFVAGGTPGAAFSFRYSRQPLYAPKGILTKPVTGAALTKAGC